MSDKVNAMKKRREMEQLYKDHPFATRLDEQERIAEDYTLPPSQPASKSPLPEVTLPPNRVERERVLYN